MLIRRHPSTQQGSIIALALIACAVLAVLGATSFMVLQNRYRLAHQTARWQEAILPAEAGIDMAINEVRKQLYMADLSKEFFPYSFDLDGDGVPDGGWQDGEPFNDANGNNKYDAGEAFRDLNGNGVHDDKGYSCTVTLSKQVDHQISFTVQAEELDPVAMGLSAGSEPYWRIRSLGTVNISGGATKAAGEKLDSTLRKLDLLTDHRTQQKIDAPKATRAIEAVLKPVSTFRLALFGTSSIDMTDHNIVVDSYDSRDANKSTYNPLLPNIPGQWIPTERQLNGDIATNGKVINAGSAHIYGDAATNGGTEGKQGVLNSENVTGDISNDFFQEVFPVNTPKTEDGKQDMPEDPGTPNTINGTTTVNASPTRVSQFRFNSITLKGSSTLRIAGAGFDATGKPIPSYAQIVVTGDINVSGNGQIIIDPGVYVRIFIVGNADIEGNGFANGYVDGNTSTIRWNSALNLQVYGVDHYRKDAQGNIVKDSAGEPIIDYGSLKIAGNGGFMGAVYAPHYNIEMKGGGNADTVFGSFVGHVITMNGVTSVHYDEALGDGGVVGEYKVVSWFEDIR